VDKKLCRNPDFGANALGNHWRFYSRLATKLTATTFIGWLRNRRENRPARKNLALGGSATHAPAKEIRACVTSLPSTLWPSPVFVFRIADTLTATGSAVRSVFAGVEVLGDGSFQALLDWQLLDRLNSC